jgi:DNA-binding NtrC family response regulator
MFKGTMKDNTQDMLKKHRNNNAKGEKNPAYKHITVDMMLDAIQNSPNKKIASRALGISTETLRSKIRLYKIEREVELCQVIAK